MMDNPVSEPSFAKACIVKISRNLKKIQSIFNFYSGISLLRKFALQHKAGLFGSRQVRKGLTLGQKTSRGEKVPVEGLRCT